MKDYQAEIIAVGTELLLGQIANTNAQWISKQLAKNGINIHFHQVVGDNLRRVSKTFSEAQDRSDIIIVTGGLGPTEDDLTREAFQSISGLDLVIHAPSLNKIKAYFNKHDSEMTSNNIKQARVFRGANVLINEAGMAPGMIVQFKEKTWVFLPGVPGEMMRMFSDDVIPYLGKLTGQEQLIKSMILRFIGIGEAKLEHELYDLIRGQSNPTIAPLAQQNGLIIRLTAKASSNDEANTLLEQCKAHILERVGDHYVGFDDETIEKKALFLLNQHGKTIAAAESLTGGKFTESLISVPGASQVCKGGIVCYDAEVKRDLLGVSIETLHHEGTVSSACASELAQSVLRLLKTDIGISFTGVAGPKALEGKPAGTVFIAVANQQGELIVEEHLFTGDRDAIRRKSVHKGYDMLFNFLRSKE
ncbi:MAG TPA: competence/damage-inducible protein A [Cerasibacillus sp.]|uniref:competence/damage-inducible protein A n=1 Tax=Cerasibacillus sp. TaxID=2498711 RepID=UPI002F3EFDD3